MGLGPGLACNIRLNTVLDEKQRAQFQNTETIRRVLNSAKRIAVVGLSSERTKASNMVASYLMDEGYTVIPVNPRASEILGQKSYPDLASVPVPVDVVDIFRPAAEVSAIVEDAVSIGAKAVWMQLGIIDLPSAEKAARAGLDVIVDRCIKMEHARHSGALHFAGMNTELISARRQG